MQEFEPVSGNQPAKPADTRNTVFILALFMLGGQRQAAKELGVSVRNLRYVAKGDRYGLSDQLRKDVADLLRRRGFACLELARQLRKED